MLKMTRIQEWDRGLYSCLASNSAGEVQRNFSVEVLGTSSPASLAHSSFSSCLGAHGIGGEGLLL